MNYYLPNGKKWTLEEGDWQSNKREEKKVKTKNKALAMGIAAVVLVIISTLIVTAFY